MIGFGRVVRRASDFDAAQTRLMPFVNAWVAVADSISIDQARQRGMRSAALTDTAGVFRLRLPPARTTVLEVKAIGYEPALIAVDGARYRAAVVEVTLGSAGFHAPYRGVSILVSRGMQACAP